MKVLVTGGSGYVGRFLLDALALRVGYELVATYAADASFPARFGGDAVSFRRLDLANGADARALIDEVAPDIVVHLAAISSPAACEADALRCAAVNVPTALLDAIAGRAGCRLILFSTDQVYAGDRNDPSPEAAADARLYSETDAPPHFKSGTDASLEAAAAPVNAYGRSKLALEAAAHARLGARALALRCSLVIGERARAGCLKSTFLQFLADFVQVRLAAEQAAAAEPPAIPNEPPTVETQPPTIETEPPTIQTQLPTIQTQLPTIAVFCDEWRSAVDVHDVVSAVLRLIEAPDWGAQGGPSAVPAGGVLNLGGPARLSRFELARAVVAELAPGRSAESLGVRPTRKHSAAAPRGGSGVASPADIAMDSSALVAFSGLERACLEATVRRALRADREAATVAQGAQSLKR